MKTSTERTRSRFRGAGLIVLLILSFSLLVHALRDKGDSQEAVFVPTDVVTNTKTMLVAIDASPSMSREHLTCSESIKHVASDVIVKNSGISYESAEAKLRVIWAYFEENGRNPKCADLPQLISAAYKLKGAIAANPKIEIDREARLLYTQNLSWDNQVTCLYSQVMGNSYLVTGGPQCKQKGQVVLDQDDVRTLRNFAKPLMAIAKNRYRSGDAPVELTLTIDPRYQKLLDEMVICGGQNKCPAFLGGVQSRISFAAITIMDANSSELLAVGCVGSSCERVANKELGILSAANVEVPPASTEKLLFAYALANQYPAIKERLPFEIKTSGDVGGQVRKRNEWWERAAVCDISKAESSSCSVMQGTREFARAVGWNKNCTSSPNQICGTSGILEPLGIERFSPVAGRALVASSKEGYFENVKFGQGGFLDWATYDRIREGKEKPSNYNKLENTSMAVQSVIGAGDNRVTSLGLSMLGSALYQSMSYGYIKPVVLFKTDVSQSANRVNVAAAKLVAEGMKKVAVGIEPGWPGAGTASNAFKSAMGKSCDVENCPLYGKTGTVGGKDPAYAGTTLFVGFFSVPELAAYMGVKPKADRTLAIGVLAKPVKADGTHYASQLSMAIIRELLER